MRTFKSVTSACTFLVMMTLFQSCQTQEDFFPIEEATKDPDLLNLCENGSTKDLSCNPFGGDLPTKNARAGLIASLYEGQSGWNHMDRYFAEGYRHPEGVYFSNFNVPTRAFDQGFGIANDLYLKNQAGDRLIEWFAIMAQGTLVLPEDKAEGFYHIVTISDDGIRIKIAGETVLSNPNIHPPTIDCATELIEVTRESAHSFELEYFQGPRYHISLTTFIKKVDPATFSASNLCSSNQGPAALVQEGYEIISPEWFTLPEFF